MLVRAPFRPGRLHAALLLSAVFAASGCGGDSAPQTPTGGPHEGRDEIVFRVYRSDPGGAETLAWVGTVDGPRSDSPEASAIPWIGFAQPFRVTWEADSEVAPIVGTRVRASDDPSAPLLPLDAQGNSVWGTATSFTWANAIPAADLVGVDCDTGPDCPDRRRLEPGEKTLRVLAIDDSGRLLDAALGELRYHVNYAPSAELVLDGDPDSGTPFWIAPRLGGGTIRHAVADGDTIPSGVLLQFTVRGRDRIYGSVEPDSACCDFRLDDQQPAVRVQARTIASRRVSSSFAVDVQTSYGALAADSVLSILTAPMEYQLEARVADEHRDYSETVSLQFVAGLTPRVTSLEPGAGVRILLRDPQQPPPVGEAGPLYSVEPAQRYWNELTREWSILPEVGPRFFGSMYRVTLRVHGEPHPRAAQIDPFSALGETDHPRAFSYALFGEFDPFNSRVNGVSDALDNFLDASAQGVLELTGDDGYELFVPTEFWGAPQFFAPEVVGETECLFPDQPDLARYCAIGARMREDLGRMTMQALARTTNLRTQIAVFPPLPAGGSGVEIFPTDPHRLGRVSEPLQQEFEIRMQVVVDGRSLVWPDTP